MRQRGQSAGLIPAHAGKTDAQVSNDHATKAHPRSRGENRQKTLSLSATLGSSPLTRGKQRRRPRRPQRTGLIPAHAGKTTECSPGSRIRRAHPRSRGENRGGGGRHRHVCGSSPLTRGKLARTGQVRRAPGLIPAHAGKTRRRSAAAVWSRAHPRSRGENSGRASPP